MPQIDLNGEWGWMEDPQGQADQAGLLAHRPRRGLKAVRVPGIWNLTYPDYHGPAVYYRPLKVPATWAGQRVFLVFEGCNYLTHVWLDGRLVGSHEGGYVGFEVEITAHLTPGKEQLLAVWVIHSPPKQSVHDTHLEDVASSKELWYYSYAGLWGGVRLEARPTTFVADLFVAPHLARRHAEVALTLSGRGGGVGAWSLHDGQARQVAGGTGIPGPRWRIALRDPHPWQPDDPHLYTLRVTLANGHTRAVRFGMRDIGVRRDAFTLNGKELAIKGVLLQPNYPETLINAPDRAFVRMELRRIREGGFNLIRAHLKPMLPYALDLADEMGLLIYAEPALAWIRRSPNLKRRALGEMTDMLRRDRNHPSIICWGVVNENAGTYLAIKTAVFRRIHALDPTRPAIGDSGAFSPAMVPGGGWIGHTTIKLPRTTRQIPFEDDHVYISTPVHPRAFDFFRFTGDPDRVPDFSTFSPAKPGQNRQWERKLRRHHPRIFLSEYGCGGLMDFAQAAKKYRNRTCQDARQYVEFHQGLVKDLRARGLLREFGSLAELMRQIQDLHAEGNRKQTEAIRLNPKITGYVVTQFNDVAWECCAGITDVWRDPKPAYHVMQRVNQPVIGVVQPSKHNWVTGEAIRVRAWVVAETPQPALRIRLQLIGPDGKPAGEAERTVAARGGVRPAGVLPLGQARAPGAYTIAFTVHAGRKELYRGHDAIHVFPDVPGLTAPVAGMAVIRDPEALAVDDWKRHLAAVRAGGRLLVTRLSPVVARLLTDNKLLPWALKCTLAHSSFVGKPHYLRKVPELRGLPPERIAAAPYATLMPDWSLNEVPDARILGGAFTVAIFRQPGDEIRQLGDLKWFADIMDLPLGKGLLRLCQYDIWQDDPVAAIMRRGLTHAFPLPLPTAGEG